MTTALDIATGMLLPAFARQASPARPVRSRLLICDNGMLNITAQWTLKQAKELAARYGWRPLYIINVFTRRK